MFCDFCIEQSFRCCACGRSYKPKGELTRHLADACGIEPKFQCKECGYRCKWKGDLKKHLTNVHKVDGSQLKSHGIGSRNRL